MEFTVLCFTGIFGHLSAFGVYLRTEVVLLGLGTITAVLDWVGVEDFGNGVYLGLEGALFVALGLDLLEVDTLGDFRFLV